MLPEIHWGCSWEGELKCTAGNTWRSDIAEEELGVKMDRQLEAFVLENPKPEPEPSLGGELTGALQACDLISLFSSVLMKPG